ncbi:MAG TPA: endolytic transglycosylase MltG [Candidatus Dormibacteraeota bacterium]
MRKLIALVVVVLLLGVGANSAYGWYQGQVDSAAGRDSSPVAFTINPGESADDIGQDLFSKGLIANQNVFLLYVRFTGARARFEAGHYSLRRNMTMAQIVQKLEHASAEQLQITIIEGSTINAIGRLVAAKGIGSAQDYVNAARGAWPYSFLSSRPAGADLQGYLFPDTYSLDTSATVNDLINRQLTEFGQKFTAEWRTAIAAATAARPAETIENVVILASLVQAEAKGSEAKICSVYYNRLAANMPLQVDATILFAEGRGGAITDADHSFQSPYNTYLHAGLPPGPIGNPGATALGACVSPEKTPYYYYFTDPTGATHFEATLDQFNADLQRYGVK